MAKLPKGVYAHRKCLRNGQVRLYYTMRYTGPLKPLAGDELEDFGPNSPAFMRAYLAAIDAPQRARTAGSFQSVSDAWEKSPAFARLAPRTKLDYMAAKDKIDAKWGTYPLDVIEDPKIRPRFLDWRDEMGQRSPRQADAVFGVLRLILEWGRDRGLIGLNHATRPKKLYRSNRSDKLWLPEHLTAFRSVASPQMRLALELALWTGQRQSDLLRLG